VNLTLEIVAPSGGNSGNPTRQRFGEEGGTIGRAANNYWVLLRAEVSGRHALITFSNGAFFIQDTSRNGVWLNSLGNKLVPERPYALKSGDRIFINPYEILVSIDDTSDQALWRGTGDSSSLDDPFADSPLPLDPARGISSPLPDDAVVDPLDFFAPLPDKRPRPRAPQEPPPPMDSLLRSHVDSPAPVQAPPANVSDSGGIPAGYDPFADPFFAPAAGPREQPAPRREPERPRSSVDSGSGAVPAIPRPAPAGRRGVTTPTPPRRPEPPILPEEPLPQADFPSPVVAPPPPLVSAPPPSARSAVRTAADPPTPVIDPAVRTAAADPFVELLAGAGLKDAAVTPELMRNFGEILRVVVAGVMDVLQARAGIKEEFRMRQTMFRPSDNNPLKFSANVDDALHNLLVKRNPAYLGPVEAFTDAFDDLRDHQLAILAGMRVAFERLLAEFDPQRLQEEFDAPVAKGSFGLMPAKLRYWDQFCEKRRDMVKDPEAAFADLFGEEFARAYEDQFRRLKAQRRGRTTENPPRNADSR
jgi:type VI secretion system FHA domain protein